MLMGANNRVIDGPDIEMSFTGRSGPSENEAGAVMLDEPEIDIGDKNDISAITENKDDKLTQS